MLLIQAAYSVSYEFSQSMLVAKMKLMTNIRIVRDSIRHRGLKQIYRDVSKALSYIVCLSGSHNKDFAKVCIKNYLKYFSFLGHLLFS